MAKQKPTRTRRKAGAARRQDEGAAETAEQQGVGRMQALRESVSGIRSGRGIDADRLALGAGALLICGGLVAIIIGWYGAASTGLPFEQTPYLISGGLLGVALVFLGGFVYFGYWVTRLLRESREQAERTSVLLDRIAVSLNGSGPDGGRTTSAGSFVATRGGSQFHRPDCVVVAGKSGLRKVTPSTRGLVPCGICEPV